MKNVVDLFFAYPHWPIVTGTVFSVLGLIGLSLFGETEVIGTELDDGPKLSDKEALR